MLVQSRAKVCFELFHEFCLFAERAAQAINLHSPGMTVHELRQLKHADLGLAVTNLSQLVVGTNHPLVCRVL